MKALTVLVFALVAVHLGTCAPTNNEEVAADKVNNWGDLDDYVSDNQEAIDFNDDDSRLNLPGQDILNTERADDEHLMTEADERFVEACYYLILKIIQKFKEFKESEK